MDHYIDIQIKPDAEMRENVLRNKIYAKLHKALCDLKASGLGVSFPKYHIKLGDVLRIHGKKSDLELLQRVSWLGGLTGYCEVTEIRMVPSNVKYRTVSRKQANMTEAKLRRLIKRESISSGDIKKYKAKMFTQSLHSPYLELESVSNGNKHRRYITFGKLSDEVITGSFDYFGLSKTANIPWF